MTIAAAQSRPLEYANIAIRGLRLDEIRTTQFDRALAMKPDLMTIVGGVNDVIGLRPDFEQLRSDLAAMFGEARAADVTVLTLTMPDPAKINPLGAYLRERMLRLNEITHAEAERYGVQVLALEAYAIATDPRLWAEDRLHGNAHGHERVAAGFAELLGLDGADGAWTLPLTETAEQVARRERMTADVAWARNYLGPWLAKGIRGIPHGRDVEPKRPVPTVVEIDGGDLVLARVREPDHGPGERTRRRAAPSHVAPAASPLTPYLAVADARAALSWYATALDAVQTVDPVVMPDGRVGHAELTIRGARMMLADEHPELGCPAPTAEGSPVTLHLEVGDVDAQVARLRAAGAQVDREPEDTPAGRIAVIRDPFSHRWMLNQTPHQA